MLIKLTCNLMPDMTDSKTRDPQIGLLGAFMQPHSFLLQQALNKTSGLAATLHAVAFAGDDLNQIIQLFRALE